MSWDLNLLTPSIDKLETNRIPSPILQFPSQTHRSPLTHNSSLTNCPPVFPSHFLHSADCVLPTAPLFLNPSSLILNPSSLISPFALCLNSLTFRDFLSRMILFEIYPVIFNGGFDIFMKDQDSKQVGNSHKGNGDIRK